MCVCYGHHTRWLKLAGYGVRDNSTTLKTNTNSTSYLEGGPTMEQCRPTKPPAPAPLLDTGIHMHLLVLCLGIGMTFIWALLIYTSLFFPFLALRASPRPQDESVVSRDELTIPIHSRHFCLAGWISTHSLTASSHVKESQRTTLFTHVLKLSSGEITCYEEQIPLLYQPKVGRMTKTENRVGESRSF